MEAITKIAIFKKKQIRKTIYQNEWWFSVVDVIEALTDSDRSSVYWTAMKARVKGEDGFQLSTICRQLKLLATDGKMRETDCADTEGLFRIIQSIPSPKAEPFKRWLAKVGYERVQEIENLRDHMDDFELIFTMLGERSTTEIHRQEESQGVLKLKSDANRGGKIAGVAKKELERELGRSVVSKDNYLSNIKDPESLGDHKRK